MKLKYKTILIIFWILASLPPCIGEESSKKLVGKIVRNVTYIGSDFKNGGVSGVFRGFQVAAMKLGWNINRLDGGGDADRLNKEFFKAIQSHPDAIILGGFQATKFPNLVALAKKANIILVGWHASQAPGPTKDLFVNISTDPMIIADIAAQYVIKGGHKKIGVILFNDSFFTIANEKTKRMKLIIEKCKICKVLSVENIAISSAENEVPSAVYRLNKKFGHEWTHTLAINDLYFDHINFPLKNIGRGDIINISAGDGSLKAISRIKSGRSQQIATVAEPLDIQGRQIADELNRAFAKKPPSGFVTKPLMITSEFLHPAKKPK